MAIRTKIVGSKGGNPKSKSIEYPIEKFCTPQNTMLFILCVISIMFIILSITELLHHNNKSPELIEESTTRLIETEKTSAVEEETTHLVEAETTRPVEEESEQPRGPNHFVSYNAYTVAMRWHLVTVSQNKMHVNITSTEENFKACNIILTENITESISGAALGNKIAIWSTTKRQIFGTFRYTEYTILYFDPHQCSYKALPIIEDQLAISQFEFPPVVLVYQDSLEFFFPSQTICFPCRFDANGIKTELLQQIQPVTDTFGQFHLQTIKRPGKDLSYAYMVKYNKKNLAMLILNKNFEVINQLGLGNSNVIAVNSATNVPYIGIYYEDPANRTSASYGLFNAKNPTLIYLFRANIPLSKDHITQTATVFVDLLGNSYVTIIECTEMDEGRNIILLRYGRTGRLISKIKLRKLEDRKKYNVQTIMLDANRYCLVVHEINDNGSGVTDIKCHNVAEMVSM